MAECPSTPASVLWRWITRTTRDTRAQGALNLARSTDELPVLKVNEPKIGRLRR